VPLSQSTTLKAKLESAGVPVRLVIYQNVGHGWQGESLVSSFSEIENFLEEYVR
jgi:dipeptidyl aminopeptidase/acylaminoacyl peptidase